MQMQAARAQELEDAALAAELHQQGEQQQADYHLALNLQQGLSVSGVFGTQQDAVQPVGASVPHLSPYRPPPPPRTPLSSAPLSTASSASLSTSAAQTMPMVSVRAAICI